MTDPLPSETFAVGEVAIYVRPGSVHHGDEVTIVAGPQWLSPRRDALTGECFEAGERFWGYKIEDSTGRWSALPQWLRKKRPPREDLKVLRWDQCPWQPESINV